ncbi:MAG: hypothetical protein JSV27_12135 [Candidatus Bathyarchaeota archaeon]|nr:MAG: hypothetical protein JSV27_12135 [Candidatus Bathyarchaeota archaeon]
MKERRYHALLIPITTLTLYSMGLNISLPIGSLLAVTNTLWMKDQYNEYVSGVLLVLSGFELLALLHWLFFIPLNLTSPFGIIANVENSIYRMTVNVSIIFVLGLFLAWIPKTNIILREKLQFSTIATPRLGGEKGFWSIVLLLFSVVLAIVAAVYPYNPMLNPQGSVVGADAREYIKVAENLEADRVFLYDVLRGPRSLIFILIWSYRRLLSIDIPNAVRFLPILLNPLIVLASFFIGKESSDDWWVGSWAAFFTACSYQVTVGMFSHFLANMLALSLVFISLGFLFRAIRLKSKRSLAYACMIGSLLVFTHPWTYTQYLSTTIITTTVVGSLAYVNRSDYDESKVLIIYTMSLGLSNIFKELLLGGYGGVTASSTVITRIYNIGNFWARYKLGVMMRYGGYLINLVVFFFALLGILSRKKKETPDIYFTALLFASSPFFFISEFNILARLLYNLPIGLLTAYGFMSVLRSQIDEKVKFSLIFFTGLYLTVYLIRSVAILV